MDMDLFGDEEDDDINFGGDDETVSISISVT